MPRAVSLRRALSCDSDKITVSLSVTVVKCSLHEADVGREGCNLPVVKLIRQFKLSLL